MKLNVQKGRLQNQHGATVVLVALMASILIGIAAFAIDIGYLYAARNELQNTSDAAALAAARQLGKIYQPLSYDEQQSYNVETHNLWVDNFSKDQDTIINAAQEVAIKNRAGGKNITVAREDVQIGDWDGGSKTFTLTLDQPDAVKVISRRDETVNGPIATFFANIFDIESVPVSAAAVAALTGSSTTEPGELPLPIGISKEWFSDHLCGQPIAFSPSNDPDSCAGWNNWQLKNANDNQTRDILDNLQLDPGDDGFNPDLISPELTAGTSDSALEYIGGELSQQVFSSLLDAFQTQGYDVAYESGGVYYPITDSSGNPVNQASVTQGAKPLCKDENSRSTICNETYQERIHYTDGTPRNLHAWDASVPVYDLASCDNPQGDIVTIGFAPIQIQEVIQAGNGPDGKIVKGIVVCEMVEPEENRGGGGAYGIKSPIPNLVE